LIYNKFSYRHHKNAKYKKSKNFCKGFGMEIISNKKLLQLKGAARVEVTSETGFIIEKLQKRS
jgi:hypothetical protein